MKIKIIPAAVVLILISCLTSNSFADSGDRVYDRPSKSLKQTLHCLRHLIQSKPRKTTRGRVSLDADVTNLFERLIATPNSIVKESSDILADCKDLSKKRGSISSAVSSSLSIRGKKDPIALNLASIFFDFYDGWKSYSCVGAALTIKAAVIYGVGAGVEAFLCRQGDGRRSLLVGPEVMWAGGVGATASLALSDSAAWVDATARKLPFATFENGNIDAALGVGFSGSGVSLGGGFTFYSGAGVATKILPLGTPWNWFLRKNGISFKHSMTSRR